MASCFHPFFISNPTPSWGREKIPVPCGKCPPCLQRRASAWSFRLTQALKVFPSVHFLTLTYEDPPISKKNYMTLVRRDWQLFMKRLRRYHPKQAKIAYYAVGEYGSKTWRPHYHAIILGSDAELISKAWSDARPDADFDKKRLILPGKPGIFEADSDVNPANIAYVTKYITKGKQIPLHPNDDREPEFALMSKNLGKNYMSSAIINYHKSDPDRMYVTNPDGIKLAMPRYYRDRIYTETERATHALKVAKLAPLLLEQSIQDFYKKRPLEHFERSYSESVKAVERRYFLKSRSDREKI
jgi:hypothetical protein